MSVWAQLTAGGRASTWHFSIMEPDDRGVNQTRGYACEVVAWRFLSHLSERERIDYLLYELPLAAIEANDHGRDDSEADSNDRVVSGDRPRPPNGIDETSLLLPRAPVSGPRPLHARRSASQAERHETAEWSEGSQAEDHHLRAAFEGLNALEIAAVADAKKFLSQRSVQTVVNDIWNGHIIFWESLSPHTTKKAQIYNKRSVSYPRRPPEPS